MKRFLFVLLLLVFSIITCDKEEENPVSTSEIQVYEGGGNVGFDGARVQITNPENPLNGTFVEIPEGGIKRY
jgi:hypothetical protein